MARALIKAAKQPEHGAASLQILLSSGYDPDARDEDGATALLWASRNGSADCVRILLEAKASVNVHDNLGWTPLMAASFSNSPEAVRALLEGGADPRVETKDSFETALVSAREVGSKACVELISGALSADELLVEAAKGGDVRQLDAALAKGASLDGAALLLRSQAHHRERCTPLHWACANGHVACAQRLIDVGCDVDAADSRGWTPLMAATCEWQRQAVRALLTASADPWRQNSAGHTALSCIAPGSSNPCVALLQEAMKQRGPRERDDKQLDERAQASGVRADGAATSANRATSNVALEVAAVEVVDAQPPAPAAKPRLGFKRVARRVHALLGWARDSGAKPQRITKD